MVFNELKYFSENANQSDTLLKALRIECVESDQRLGFFLRWNKYGRVIEKQLSTDFSSQSLLLYKPFIEKQIKQLELEFAKNPMLEIYIVAHRMLNLSGLVRELKSIGFSTKNIYLLTSSDLRSGFIFQDHEIQDWGLEFVGIQKIPIRLKAFSNVPIIKKQASSLPFAVATFIKIVLSPFLEIKRAYQLLQVSQFIWSKRLYELFSFLGYLLKSLVLLLYAARYLYGTSQRITIPAYFKTRHLLLMSRFKTYGILVDSYFWIKENMVIRSKDFLKLVFIRLYFALKHPTYLIAVKDFLKIFAIRMFFLFRHVLLMLAYKAYGFIVDLSVFTFYFVQREGHRFYVFFRYTVMRILLFPIFKIYWFSEFQYHKRIKKIIWME